MRRGAQRAASCGTLMVALMTPVNGHGDYVLRCRSGRLVDVGMLDAEVVARCGEPKSRC